MVRVTTEFEGETSDKQHQAVIVLGLGEDGIGFHLVGESSGMDLLIMVCAAATGVLERLKTRAPGRVFEISKQFLKERLNALLDGEEQLEIKEEASEDSN